MELLLNVVGSKIPRYFSKLSKLCGARGRLLAIETSKRLPNPVVLGLAVAVTSLPQDFFLKKMLTPERYLIEINYYYKRFWTKPTWWCFKDVDGFLGLWETT